MTDLKEGYVSNEDAQMLDALMYLKDFQAYADSIGCRVSGEGLECDQEQFTLLQQWWRKNKKLH